MITNNDLTGFEVAEICLSLKSTIERLQNELERSERLYIAENVKYYSERLQDCKALYTKMSNTVGMKR